MTPLCVKTGEPGMDTIIIAISLVTLLGCVIFETVTGDSYAAIGVLSGVIGLICVYRINKNDR